jgi:hypothetical protein
MSTALRAAKELHRRRGDLDLSRLKPALEQLADHPSKTLKDEAGTLLSDLNKSP